MLYIVACANSAHLSQSNQLTQGASYPRVSAWPGPVIGSFSLPVAFSLALGRSTPDTHTVCAWVVGCETCPLVSPQSGGGGGEGDSTVAATPNTTKRPNSTLQRPGYTTYVCSAISSRRRRSRGQLSFAVPRRRAKRD